MGLPYLQYPLHRYQLLLNYEEAVLCRLKPRSKKTNVWSEFLIK
jgi:hypothetical protein